MLQWITQTRLNKGKDFFIIPFIDKLSNIIISCLNKKLFVVEYKSMNRLNNIIKIQKIVLTKNRNVMQYIKLIARTVMYPTLAKLKDN